MSVDFYKLSAIFISLCATSVHATDDSVPNDPIAKINPPNASFISGMRSIRAAITDAQIYKRTEEVFNEYGIADEPNSLQFLQPLQAEACHERMKGLLPYFDPSSSFSKFFTVANNANTGMTTLKGFYDRNSKTTLEYEIDVATAKSPSIATPDWLTRIRAAKLNPADQLLKGVKIALDPGHMGGDLWASRTGKFVHDGKGNKLDEGIMALQTSLLLAQDLEALGAEVVLTHTELTPVSTLDYDKFDLKPYGLEELVAAQFQPWFIKLLAGASLADRVKAFKNDANVKKLFAESARSRYFILRADLEARVQFINNFQPDITLIVHYDVLPPANDGNAVNPNGVNYTKSYVTGGFGDMEFAGPKQRMFFARQLLEAQSWWASVDLSRSIVSHIRDDMKIPLQTGHDSNAVKVEDGVFARNLGIPRKLSNQAVAYLECLFYNHPTEFKNFRNMKHTMMIGGKSYGYSDRLVEVKDAIRDGVIDFVKSR